MNGKKILILILALFVCYGATEAHLGARHLPIAPWQAVYTIFFLVLILMWYHFDSTARGYARSRWLNAGILLIGILAIPYYLIRSRERGKRCWAIGKLLGFVVLCFVATFIGAFAGVMLS